MRRTDFVKWRAGRGADAETIAAFNDVHRTAVEGAIAAGKHVPPEVMAEYEQSQGLARLSAMRRTKRVRPHEMTLDDYTSNHPDAVAMGPAWAKVQHREEVASAVKAGRRIPPEVLADYPDLGVATKSLAPWVVAKGWAEAKHPRGQPANAGEFRSGGTSAPSTPVDRTNADLDAAMSEAPAAKPKPPPADLRSGDIFNPQETLPRPGPSQRPKRGKPRAVGPTPPAPAPSADGRHPSAHNPDITYGHADDRDSDDAHFSRQIQAASRGVEQARRKLAATQARGPQDTPEVRKLRQQLARQTQRVAKLTQRAAKAKEQDAAARRAASNRQAVVSGRAMNAPAPGANAKPQGTIPLESTQAAPGRPNAPPAGSGAPVATNGPQLAPQRPAGANGKPATPPPLPNRGKPAAPSSPAAPPPLPHEKTQAAALSTANELSQALRAGDPKAVAYARSRFESALQVHQKEGFAAIDRMARQKYGGMKARRAAIKAKRAFVAKLDAARERLGGLAMTGKSFGGLAFDLDPLPAAPWVVKGWEESKHPRGQPENAGEFASQSGGKGRAGGKPSTGKPAAARPPAAGVVADKGGDLTTQFAPGQGERAVESLRAGLSHALADGPLYNSPGDKLVPLNMFVTLVKRAQPDAKTEDIYAALRHLRDVGKLRLHGLNEEQLLQSADGRVAAVDGNTDRKRATLWDRGKALHFVEVAGRPSEILGKAIAAPWVVKGRDVSGEARDAAGEWTEGGAGQSEVTATHIRSRTHKLKDVAEGRHPVGVEGRGGKDVEEAKRQGMYIATVGGVTLYARTAADAKPLENYLEGGGKYGTPEFSRLLGYTDDEIRDYERFLRSQGRQDLLAKSLQPPRPLADVQYGAPALESHDERPDLERCRFAPRQRAGGADVDERAIGDGRTRGRDHLVRPAGGGRVGSDMRGRAARPGGPVVRAAGGAAGAGGGRDSEAVAIKAAHPWVVKAAHDVSGEARDHGKFARTAGADSGPADPDSHARTLATKIASVPHAVRQKVSAFVRRRYAKLAARYGDTGAKAILGAAVLMTPIPVPGTTLLPIALAEIVLRLRRMTGKSMGVDDATVYREARRLLADLYAEMGEKAPGEGEVGKALRTPWIVKAAHDVSNEARDDKGQWTAEGAAAHKENVKNLLAQAKEARRAAHEHAKAGAKTAHDAATKAAGAIQEANNNLSWLSDDDAFDAYRELDELVSDYDPDWSLADRMAAFKQIGNAAKEAMRVEADDSDDPERPTPEDIANNRKHLKALLSHVKAAREALRTHAAARREMAAIRDPSWLEKCFRGLLVTKGPWVVKAPHDVSAQPRDLDGTWMEGPAAFGDHPADAFSAADFAHEADREYVRRVHDKYAGADATRVRKAAVRAGQLAHGARLNGKHELARRYGSAARLLWEMAGAGN